MNEFFDAGNYAFTIYPLPVVLVGLMTAALGVATLVRERGSTVSVAFAAMVLSTAIWLLGFAGAYATTNPDVAVDWLKVMYFGLAFLPTGVLAFTFAVTNRFDRYWPVIVVCAVVSALTFGINASTHILVDHVHHYFWGYYPILRLGAVGFSVFQSGCLILSAIVLRSAHRSTHSPTQKRRLRALLIGLSIAYLASLDWLPSVVDFYPFGYVFVAIFVLITTRAIWRYRLVDVTLALAAKQIIETMGDALIVLDAEGTIRVANQEAAAMLEPGGEELIGRPISDVRRPPFAGITELTANGVNHTEISYAGGAGERTVIVSSSVLKDRTGNAIGTVYMAHDISERKRAEEEIRRSEEHFRSLIENGSDIILVLGQDASIRYASASVAKTMGYDMDAVRGMNALTFVHPEDLPDVEMFLQRTMLGTNEDVANEFRVQHADGSWRVLESMSRRVIDPDGCWSVVINCRDISERKRAEDTIRFLAHHDALTGLPNRELFKDRLALAIRNAHRKHQQIAVMFLDLDEFKDVNDTVGHAEGDRLLQFVANRLSGFVRDADTLARLGGDEFTILLSELEDLQEASMIADRILEGLRRPWLVDGHEFHVTASMGLTIFPSDGADPETLLRNADTAMYRAKRAGKNKYQLYTPAMNEQVAERVALENDLRRAVENKEFVLYYQPQVDISTGQVVGAEALLRWNSPSRGLVYPADFISVAEAGGLIVPIGEWVLRRACQDASDWNNNGECGPLRVAVNLSARQFGQNDLLATVATVLEETGLAPIDLQLEITEGTAVEDVEFTVDLLSKLRTMGVAIAIDDFGTGHSSLSYLKRLPIDVLKIDQSFVADVVRDETDAALVRAIISIGHSMGLKVIAEGVETTQQLAFLREPEAGVDVGMNLHCDEFQGFLYSKAVPLCEFLAIARGRPLRTAVT